MRLLGSFAVLALVSFAFMPFILAQKDFFLAESAAVLGAGAGAFRFPPVALFYDARPLAFNPPLGFLPSLRVHASVILFLLCGFG